MLPDIDIVGQEKLIEARVLIVGLGGLGSPVALYLAASGVGSLTLADFDSVDISNLQRQILHTTESIGVPKTESARRRIFELNPDVKTRLVGQKMSLSMLEKEVVLADIVVDCTDNFEVRFAINEACLRQRTTLVTGAAIRLEGQLMVIDAENEAMPCYCCLYQSASQGALNCSETGVAAPIVGIIGALQAMETLKLIVGVGESLAGYLLTFDARFMDWRKLKLPQHPDCQACKTFKNR
mgnify:CR=1 FL=1